jgi:hypothetical protein
VPEAEGAPPEGLRSPVAASPLSDLAIRFQARGEFGGDWARFRPCDATLQLTCNPGLVPRLYPDLRFGLRMDGWVADRLRVDVDFDQSREFSAANRFQLQYRGKAGEWLKGVEVGDVTLDLPATQFLTRGIPQGNFGMLASAGGRGLTLQALVAQQQGTRQSREFRLGRGELGVIREDTLVLEDADWVQGQFFFLVDPRSVSGYPQVDVLNLRPEDAPPDQAPGPEPIQLWRMERDPLLRQQVEGFVRADAALDGPGGERVQESGWFRYLRPGVDYDLHPSGLWVALRIPLGPEEALAVTYQTQFGDRVGDYNPERIQKEGGVPRLRLIRATRARHQPGRPTWERELKQFYRIAGAGTVDLESVELEISLGERSGGQTFRRLDSGRRISLLRFFGLDEDAPRERVDRTAFLQPETLGMGTRGGGGTYLVFPTLQPFLDPPAIPSEGLEADAVRQLLGADANRRIYLAEDPLDRQGSGLFRLNLSLRSTSQGGAASFPLGAFGVREGSERVRLGDQLLRPGVDYLLDPEMGVITLLQPDFLLSRSASERLQVTWEQISLFRPRPTNLIGGGARADFGAVGGLDLLGLLQVERDIVLRPRFGAEPGSVGMVGGRTDLAWSFRRLDRALDWVLGGRETEAPTALRVSGEWALSLPNPNISGDAYLDDFDGGEERTLSLLSPNWHLGSAPEPGEAGLPLSPQPSNALPLVWQHSWVESGPQGDSIGVFEGFFPRSDIDRQISIAGSQTREPGLLLSFGRTPGTVHPTPRWRSFTTLLSPTGADLTQTEALEFYVAEGDALTLVLDLGLVSEDALFIDGEGRTSGFRTDTGRAWGAGILDQEADPLRGEIWDPTADRRGVWPESCLGEAGRVYPIGDVRANCTRGNGRRDTEDLNGNGVLDTEERFARYVVRLDGTSPYLVRDRGETGTRFRRYRIPLRGPGVFYPTGTFTRTDWRNVQFLRVTVAGQRESRLTLARMQLVGSRWVKRGGEGVLQGIGGDTLAFQGAVDVSPVGFLTEGTAYQPPPGVLELLDDPSSILAGRGVEYQERALALRFRDLQPGNRAEVTSRFLQRPRDFLAYGELRLWALARSGDWAGPSGVDFFVKIGSDPENFYLWRVPLDRVPNPNAVSPEDWLPERVIDLEPWLALRQQAELQLTRFPPRLDGPPVIEWSPDSTYAVVLKDRARAPNLAAVREISLGVWNRGGGPTDGEVWVNELRLGRGIRTPGSARMALFELDGGDRIQARVGLEGRGPRFRTLEEAASFQEETLLQVSGSVQLGGHLPERWGWDLPVTFSHVRSDRDPFFLAGSDLRGGALLTLRTDRFRDTRGGVTGRFTGTVGHAGIDRVLRAFELRGGLARSEGRSLTQETATWGAEGEVVFDVRPEPRLHPLVPDLLEPVVRILLPPRWARRLNEVEVQWTPELLRVSSLVRWRRYAVSRYDQILLQPWVSEDASEPDPAEEAPERWLDSRVRMAFRPGGSLTLGFDLDSRRDLLDPEVGIWDPETRTYVDEARRSLFGTDLGWETRRELVARFGLRPQPARGVRMDLSGQSRFGSQRSAQRVRVATPGGLGETEASRGLLREVRVDRDLRAGVSVDPARVLRVDLRPDAPSGGRAQTRWARGLRTVSPIQLTLQDGVVSAFFREDVSPDLGFQLGWGGVNGLSEWGEVRATTLVHRTLVSGGAGLQLPASLFVNLNAQGSRIASLDRRSERDARTLSWPDVRAGASQLPLPERWRGVLQRVAFTTGVQRVREEVDHGNQLQARLEDDLRFPGELAVEWTGGLTTRYRGTLGKGEGRDPTGLTRRDQIEHGVSLETRIAPGRGLSGRIEGPFRLALNGQLSSIEACRVAEGRQVCIPFLDLVQRSAGFSLDTVLSGVEIGGQVSVVDRSSFTGMRTGYTQFQLGFWGRMEFLAGPVERLDRRGRDPFSPGR